MKISNEIKVSLFAIVAILILIVGYNFLKGNSIFGTTQYFYVFYKNVDGLGVANEVQINGFKVGKVKSLEILPNKGHLILAKLEVDNDIHVPTNSQFVINSVPLSTTTINLKLGTSSTYATNGDTLEGISNASILSQFTQELEPVKEKAIIVVQSIDTILTQLKDMMKNGGKTGLQNSINDIQLTIHNLKLTTEKVDGLVKAESERLDAILKNADAITTNLKNNNATITSALKNIDKITDDIAKSNLKQTIENTNATVADLAIVINKIKKGEGSMGLLVNDDKLYNNLKSSSENLDKLVIDLKANPHRYIHFSVFGKKDKK